MKTNPADKVEQWAISKLTPYARNARTHSDAQVAQLAASIREWGWTTPILVSPDGGVIAGHGRLLAARQLGMVNVPVIVAEGWSDAKTRAYVLADNQLALQAGWDNELLALELGELGELGFDLDLTGFGEGEIAALTPGGTEGLTDPDEVPEPPVDPTTKPGDLWTLGDHRLLCGDSTKAEDVARLMGGEKADACVTDPPYGIGVDSVMHKQSGTQYGTAAAPKRNYAATEWDKLPPQSAIDNAAAFPQAIIFGGNYFNLPPARCWLVWDKENDATAFADCELAWTNLDQPVRIKRHMWNGMIRKDKEERSIHPTQKPAGVMSWCVGMTDGIVYDPFLGSGTTLIAAEQLGRKCYGMEISPAYCDVIVKRWESFTGKQATRESARVS